MMDFQVFLGFRIMGRAVEQAVRGQRVGHWHANDLSGTLLAHTAAELCPVLQVDRSKPHSVFHTMVHFPGLVLVQLGWKAQLTAESMHDPCFAELCQQAETIVLGAKDEILDLVSLLEFPSSPFPFSNPHQTQGCHWLKAASDSTLDKLEDAKDTATASWTCHF